MAAKGGRSTHDIFLSFRGEDTREIFTTRLYSALRDAGFGTFIDDNGIERGEDIKSELIRAIQHSRGSIVVLSENYANSGWCLDELAMIVENKKRKGHVILPVFYYVTPSQVGKQMGSFGEAFNRFEERFIVEEKDENEKSEWTNKVRKWKAALSAVAELDGMALRLADQDDEEYETRFIQKIVKVIDDKLNRAVLTGANELIGIDSRVKRINSWIVNASTDAGILAICGVGGIGKTTIAKFSYNLNIIKFQATCFIANVREICKQPDGLVCLQMQLLSGILNRKQEKINSVGEGIVRIKDAVLNKKILLVLDDIDQVDQLNIVLGMRVWFDAGSRIILTSRHEHLFKPNEAYKVHKVKPLDDTESLQLLSLYAFGRDHPVETFMDVSLKILDRCEGLPLALKILGSSLSGRSLDVWENQLEKLKEVANNQIQKILRISYDSLPDDHDRNLFLHIGCFFVERKKDYICTILDECGFYTAVGIQSLKDRCLLNIESWDNVSMHQMVQDMGREVVRQESPRNPGKRSRLWRYKDSYDVLRDNSGTEAIEGLVLDMGLFHENESGGIPYSDLDEKGDGMGLHGVMQAFSCHPATALYKSNELNLKADAFALMNKLKLLQLNYLHLTGSYEYLPKSLKWLCWHGFPSKSIPNSFPLESLVALDLRKSKLKFWKPNKVATFLKILDLSCSFELLCTPNFTSFPNLDRLILMACVSVSEIHDSIGNLRGLVLLNLENCISLKKLPVTIAMLSHLETLVISGCSSLVDLPKEMKNMASLKVLHAAKTFTETTDMKSWKAYFWALVSKPRKAQKQIYWDSLPSYLVDLSLEECNLSESDFPKDLCNLIHLKELNLSRNPLSGTPDFISRLKNLQTLHLINCWKLQSLQHLPDIESLRVYSCKKLESVTHLSILSQIHSIGNSMCENLTEVQGLFTLKPLVNCSPEELIGLGILNFESVESIMVNLQVGITYSSKKRPCQMLYEFGITSMSVPAREVPNWFSHKTTGLSISFVVPSHPNQNIRGINIGFVYVVSNCNSVDWFPEHQLFVKVCNKTKDVTWVYFPTCFGIPELDQDLLWVSFWTFQDQLDNGDEVDVSIIPGDSFLIRECGINFVCREQEDNISDVGPLMAGVIGGNLSAFQLSSGVFYLCRTPFLRNYEEEQMSRPDDWTITNWGRNVFGGPVDFEELRYVHLTGRNESYW